jgi:hypothetical protein
MNSAIEVAIGQEWVYPMTGARVVVTDQDPYLIDLRIKEGGYAGFTAGQWFTVTDSFLRLYFVHDTRTRVKAPRASTTARITNRIADLVRWSCRKGEPVLVRHKGKEVGAEWIGAFAVEVKGDDGRVELLPLKECTIPKATVAYLTDQFGG